MKHKAKSFIAVLLALCLMMSLGVGALAVDGIWWRRYPRRRFPGRQYPGRQQSTEPVKEYKLAINKSLKNGKGDRAGHDSG